MSRVLPLIAEAPVARIWGGLLDLTPDALPVLDRVPAVTGLFLAAGFSGHGFGIGPAVGPALADLLLGREPSVALDAFRFARFDESRASLAGTREVSAAAPLAPSLHG